MKYLVFLQIVECTFLFHCHYYLITVYPVTIVSWKIIFPSLMSLCLLKLFLQLYLSITKPLPYRNNVHIIL